MAYEKHTWVKDETITADRLNHIEGGIENIELTPGPKGDQGDKGDPGDSYTDSEVCAAIASKPEIAAISPISDPSTASSEEVAEALNRLISALKA